MVNRMARLTNYRAGVNLGHWLSQNGGKGSDAYFSHFIQESDIARIASWGMDHIRVPVDYFTFEQDAHPGIYDESRLAYIDNCLAWCKRHGLCMILDLHEAPGYSFFNANETGRADAFAGSRSNSMFSDPGLQERFIAIWEMFAKRYQAEGRSLAFELLNEIVLEDIGQWNRLWRKAVSRIRAIDADRTIIIGGNKNSDPSELQNLDLTSDEGVVYTFHFYEPGIFTHQRSPFIPYLANYPVPVTYPFTQAEHQAFFDAFAQQGLVPDAYRRDTFGKDFLSELLAPVRSFQEETGREVFCGEYGVNEFADYASTLRWYTDLLDLLNAMQIGHTAWSYVGFSTFMRDTPRAVRYPDIVEIISKKW